MVKIMLIVVPILVILIIAMVHGFIARYTIARVSGESMLPTFVHKQFVLIDKWYDLFETENLKDNLGKVIIAVEPEEEKLVIKRITDILEIPDEELYEGYDAHIWIEGDNKAPGASRDSRNYGFIQAEDILGEVVPWKTLVFKGN